MPQARAIAVTRRRVALTDRGKEGVVGIGTKP